MQSHYFNIIKQLKSLTQNTRSKIFVIGDILLDEYHYGTVERISPEYPIPVVRSDTDIADVIRPGGSACVAYQTSKFNIDCHLFGLVDHRTSEILNYKFGKYFTLYGINPGNGFANPRKIRIYDKDFPVIRWDIEQKYSDENPYDTSLLLDIVLKEIKQQLPKVVILSDYGKGLFSEIFSQSIIQTCNQLNIITIVDPKNEPLKQWNNCTIFKPNDKESIRFANSEDKFVQYNKIKQDVNPKVTVVTKGDYGVSWAINENLGESSDSIKLYLNQSKVRSLSAIGAGDCFAAMLAICLSHGLNINDCIPIAYDAGAVYVQKRFNEPVSLFDLMQRISPVDSKILPACEIANILDRSLSKIVFTNGCFDLLHSNHLKSLEWAKKQGDILIVAVDSNENVKKSKGDTRPILDLQQRMESLAHLNCVDFVTWFDGSPENVIKELNCVHTLVKGKDYSADNVLGKDLVNEVCICPTFEGASTTNIIDKILKSTR